MDAAAAESAAKRALFPQKPRPLDYGAVLLSLAVTVLSAALAYGGGPAAGEVRVRGAAGSWVFPRDAAETLAVPGPLGDTVVELRDGGVRVLSSPCANQLCAAAGTVRLPGQWIACLPNRVFVAVEGGGPDEPDGVVR